MPNITTYLPTGGRRAAASAPTADALLRRVRALTGAYLAVSLAAVGALVLYRYDHLDGNASAWVHAVIIAATALGSFSASVLAAHGNRGAFMRLRVISVVLVAAVAVIVALPGSFPLWMKLSEAVGAVLMAAVAVTVNGRTLRSRFERR
jgi:peptidoglycan/LPS O-acetylase OafA/YrhL